MVGKGKEDVLGQEPTLRSPQDQAQPRRRQRPYRAGTVPFLIGRPLIHDLDSSDQIELVRAAPSLLKGMLAGGELDAAILPASDLPCFGPKLTLLPAGCIAAAGPTLVARIFAQVKADSLTVLWADNASRSAVVLVQVLWAYLYRRRISIIPFDASRDRAPNDAEAVLLVGDRVVTEPPIGFDWQFDPSAIWYEMTGLPFVFAVWATMRDSECPGLYRLLLAARQAGQRHLEQIASQYGPAYGWPVDLAVRCLSEEVQFEFGEEQREGLEEFLQLAAECELIQQPQPLQYYAP